MGLIALALYDWWRWYTNAPDRPLTMSIMASRVTVIAVFQFRRTLKETTDLALGVQGERDAACTLEDLRPAGYRFFHDLEAERGAVDHVAIGPAGVFVIETKTRSKPVGRHAKVEYDGTRVLVDG